MHDVSAGSTLPGRTECVESTTGVGFSEVVGLQHIGIGKRMSVVCRAGTKRMTAGSYTS